MKASIRVLAVSAVLGGSIALPLSTSAATRPTFSLTLSPASIVIPYGQTSMMFILWNNGTDAQSISVQSDSWVVPSIRTFTIQPGEVVKDPASIVIPANPEGGDHDQHVTFLAAPQTGGTVSGGLGAYVIIETATPAIYDLRVTKVSTPFLAGSNEHPSYIVTLSNFGNVHASYQLANVGTVRISRGDTRTYRIAWRDHPFIGVGTMRVGDRSASTIFLPWHWLLGFLLTAGGIGLIVDQLRRRVRITLK